MSNENNVKINNSREHKGRSIITFPSEYIVMDIETTGLDTIYDEIIEISALKISDGKIIEEYSRLVKPESGISEFISSLTGITNDMLENEDSIEEVLPSFIEFIGDDVLIGHNVNFDINFLYDNLERTQNQFLENDFIDTLRIARRVLPELKHHRLDDLIEYFGLEDRSEHRALNDCKLTNMIFENLKEQIINQNGSLESFKNEYKKHRKYNNHHNSVQVKAKDIEITVDEIDPDNPFYGKVCVFTGVLARMPRKDAMQLVVNLGGTCGDSVTKKTNYLILGNNDYCSTIKDGKSSKQKKAESLKLAGEDIEIISENVFYDMLES